MRKTLFSLGLVFFTLALYAEDPPSSEPSKPTLPDSLINLSEVKRAKTEILKTPEEDASYFGGATSRLERERIVIINQTRMSLADSDEDMTIIYLLTVFDSTGECYGLCPDEQVLPKEDMEEVPRIWRLEELFPSIITATLIGGFSLYKNHPSGWFCCF